MNEITEALDTLEWTLGTTTIIWTLLVITMTVFSIGFSIWVAKEFFKLADRAVKVMETKAETPDKTLRPQKSQEEIIAEKYGPKS